MSMFDDQFVIDKSKLVEPDESEDEEGPEESDVVGFDSENLMLKGESIVDDPEFDDERDTVYETYDPNSTEDDEDM